MKKYLLILLLTLISNYCRSQNFGAAGSVWHYNQGSFGGPGSSPIFIQKQSDTIVYGRACFILSVDGASCVTSNHYIVYESNDSVYYFVNNLNRFCMLYNFNAAVGDTLNIYGDRGSLLDTVILKVDSIHTILINGVPKKQFYTSPIFSMNMHSNLYFGGVIIEDIGSLILLFPQYGTCDPVSFGLRCYQDSAIGLYQTGIVPSCDTILLDIDKLKDETNFQLQPNPFENKISIKTKIFTKNKITVTDCVGKLVYSNSVETTANKEETITLDFLQSGLYFLSIENVSGKSARKIIKE